MEDSFDKKFIREVKPENPCDICSQPAGYYSLLYYIHICSKECLMCFEESVLKEASEFAIKKLKPLEKK